MRNDRLKRADGKVQRKADVTFPALFILGKWVIT